MIDNLLTMMKLIKTLAPAAWHGLPVIRRVGELKTCSSRAICV